MDAVFAFFPSEQGLSMGSASYLTTVSYSLTMVYKNNSRPHLGRLLHIDTSENGCRVTTLHHGLPRDERFCGAGPLNERNIPACVPRAQLVFRNPLLSRYDRFDE